MTKILLSLPEKYQHFTSAWESVEKLSSKLLIEEERVMSLERDTASAVKSKKTTKKRVE